jgi:uncharacterized protein
MLSPTHTNRLIHSTSPYLLQHAHNPVDWYEWSEEALIKSQNEDKPILLSIGYSSCHWCHVMAHQSFEDADIAGLMNEHFVCIKLDREERPDIDHIYMEAVQAMGQNGGWPLNVFLTPSQKPFFGGTYFPPKNWAQLLIQISKAFKDRRAEIESSANELGSHLNISDLQRFQKKEGDILQKAVADKMFALLESRFDFTCGGIDKAPKFIMPSTWLLLMRYYVISKNLKALEMLNLTLKKISRGGIYDQIGGGFARYSVDGEWFAPHFEKMLYDNGQLLSLYAEAYQLTKDADYKKVIYQTIEWLQREMKHSPGGFYSALDADSEGEEGIFYTWTWAELQEALGADVEAASKLYQLEKTGNWEHGRTILIRTDVELDVQFLDVERVEQINRVNEKLFAYREKKERPSLDDKIVTSWNAMTIVGLVDCYKAFGEDTFLALAKNAMRFLEEHLIQNKKLYRSFKGKHSVTAGFLDDHAYLIQAYTHLYQVTFDETYLRQAKEWCDFTLQEFYDTEEGFFFYTANSSESLIARKKEIFDNVIPSSNSVMAGNLYHLGMLLSHEEWKNRAESMVSKLANIIESEPVYLSHWGLLALEMIHEMDEIVVVGKNAEGLRKELHQQYLPFSFTLGTTTKSDLPLIKGRESNVDTIYVCRNQTCQLPVHSVGEALSQINSYKI